jgi:RNA polymerase sigma-70 factor (ECF subfamily)
MTDILTVPAYQAELTSQPMAQSASKPECARLIKQVAAGDQLAFTRLRVRTSGLLFGLLLRILGHSQTAEEVLAQVYLEVWQRANEFDEKVETSLTWLVIIAHRRALEELHQEIDRGLARIDGNRNSAPGAVGPETNIAVQEQLVRSAIGALSLAQREMLELSFFSGMNESEIADYLGFSQETVRLGLSLAMKKLSALFSFLDSSPEPEKTIRTLFSANVEPVAKSR